MAELPVILRKPIGTDIPLPGWRANVGKPLAFQLAPPADPEVRSLLVLSWNVWIGRGNLAGLIRAIRGGAYAGAGFPAGLPLVALVQEAYRADETVRAISNGHTARDFSSRSGHEHQISAIARELVLDLRYAPSMRNGSERSDRGNAILSSLPLEDAAAVELPFGMQRRVAVSATVRIAGRRLRLTSAHLDPRGARARDLLGIAGRRAQVRGLLESMRNADSIPRLLGADLNLARQRREPAFRALVEAGFVTGIPAREPGWGHTYHRLPRLLLDWLLVSGNDGISRMEVQRLDEHPRDTGPYVFGSDHHPLLARIDLDPDAGVVHA